MTSSMSFSAILHALIQRDGRRVRQLSQASADHFGENQQIPHNTISRWVQGTVKKPRSWQDILKLAVILRLQINEVDQLLTAAGHPHLAVLHQASANQVEDQLLALWQAKPATFYGPFQAPPGLPNFTGRQEERKAVATVLAHSQTQRICCLQGMGGVGKTSLAIQLAYDLRDVFADGVLWAQLDRSNTMAILHSFATAFELDIRHYLDVESRSSKVRELLSYKKALIILDNAESDEQLRPLLPPTGSCAVLFTTRRQDLAVADQARRFLIQSFAPEKGDSLALFGKILGTETIQREREKFQELANILGHLPLALDIAANRLRHELNWSVHDLLTQWQADPDRLTHLARGDRAVRLSFAFSFRALKKEQQQLFAALSVFVGSFSCEAAAAIEPKTIDDTASQLQQLQALSLVQQATNGRFQLHPLLRLYSQELGGSPETAVRMAHYYFGYIQQNQQAYERLDLEQANILAALDIAIAHGLHSQLVQSSNQLYAYCYARGYFETAHYLLQAAQNAAQEIGDKVGLTAVLFNMGHIAIKQGNSQQAEHLYQQALTIARQTNNLSQISNLLMKLGALAHRRSQFSLAQDNYLEALRFARKANDTNCLASTLANLGLLAAVQGDQETAVAHYNEALPLARQLGNKSSIINILQNLGAVADDQGNYAEAKAHFQEGLEHANELGTPELRSRLLGNLGLVACALGNYAEASAYFREGLALAEQANLTLQISRQRANLGKVAMHRRQYPQANYHYQEALALARRLGFPEDIAVMLNQWGDCHLAQQNGAAAEAAFREALQIAELANLQSERAKSLYGLAHTAAERGNTILARQLGERAQQIFVQTGHKKANEVAWWLAELPSH